MEKHGKGGRRTKQAPASIVGLGETEYRAEPQFCPSECLIPHALFCSQAGPGLGGLGTFSLCTQKGALLPQGHSLLTTWIVSCKVPGGRRWGRRKRQALAGEPHAGVLAHPCLSSQLLWYLSGPSASSLFPPEKAHNNQVTSAILPRPGRLHWDSTQFPCPRLVTFSNLHPFYTRLFAE